jgi:hypothetical protein
MQIFRYRLGTSAPGADSNQKYTPTELIDQLGAALFRDRPVQSQLHSFTEPVEKGRGWCVSPSPAIPSCHIELLLPLQEIENSSRRALQDADWQLERLVILYSGILKAQSTNCEVADDMEAAR